MITIAFYSYKGGVGRSLAVTNLAVYLTQFGATVAMVDFDLEAPGLQYKVRPDAPIEVTSRGIAGVLADASLGRPISDMDWDLAIDVSEHVVASDGDAAALDQPRGRLLLIPAGNPTSAQYWRDIAAIDWTQLFMGPHRRGVSALAHLKTSLESQFQPDVLLVDSRTGITPGGGVATTLLPDVVVTMMLNTPEHLDGTRLVVAAVVASGNNDRQAPVVVPVLSRYTKPNPTEPRLAGRPRPQPVFSTSDSTDEVPLDALRLDIVRDLPADLTERVAEPLVLHTDLSLQHKERLVFGPYAVSVLEDDTQTLLEDYLRLFAGLVPREMFLRYLTGVRSRVRGILLDNPDDAVRTLESLATLVGDEAAFVNLVKVYVLRRDTRRMLVAADRLFRVHHRIIAHPALSEELRSLVVRGAGSASVEPPLLDAEFAEQYWREVASGDVEWGAGLARFLADSGLADRARALAVELIERNNDTDVLAVVVRTIADGRKLAETLAALLASEYFELGKTSSVFLSAAATACRYHPTPDLAHRILDAPGAATIPDAITIALLLTVGRYEEAGALLLEALATTDAANPRLLERYSGDWEKVVRRLPHLKEELRQRNVQVADYLESTRDPRYADPRHVIR